MDSPEWNNGWLDILMCLWILAHFEARRPSATLERQNSNHRKNKQQ